MGGCGLYCDFDVDNSAKSPLMPPTKSEVKVHDELDVKIHRNPSKLTDCDDIVEGRRNSAEQPEAAEHNASDEDRIVVENRENGRLKVRNFVLLPENSFVLFLARHLIVGEQLGHLTGDGVLALYGDLVFQVELGVAIGHRQEIGADCGEGGEECDR